jgi:hypothetical protein
VLLLFNHDDSNEAVKEKIILKRMWCWWCCHPFEGTPLNMPLSYDDRRNSFRTTGNFCSWSCMKTYALDKYGCGKGSMVTSNMVMMRRRMYGKKALDGVKPAPWRYRLKVFGGDMTIEEFRSNQTIDKEIPKTTDTKPILDNIIPVISNTKKMDEIKNSTSNNNALKLKRTKPLKRSHNNLESALGLIITPKT